MTSSAVESDDGCYPDFIEAAAMRKTMDNTKEINETDEIILAEQLNLESPPYIKRSSRSKQFKNPPQPSMCIRDMNRDGREVYINVLGWNKISKRANDTDPVPLYGGMRVS